MQATGEARAKEPEREEIDPTEYNVEAIARAERESLQYPVTHLPCGGKFTSPHKLLLLAN